MSNSPRTTCITPAQIAGDRAGDVDLLQAARRGLLAGASVLALVLAPMGQAGLRVEGHGAVVVPASHPGLQARTAARSDFGATTPSPDARLIADWVADSNNNAGMAFVIVDKRFARLHVFDAGARWLASSPILLGAARGDDSVVGIGNRPLAEVRPEERTTPAGRFVSERGRNSLGDDVVWVDYEAAVSMHRVRTTTASEHRLQRMASSALDDHRISWGCINVPVAFFESFVAPMFVGRRAVVYVLPEVKSLRQVFGVDDAASAPDQPARIPAVSAASILLAR